MTTQNNKSVKLFIPCAINIEGVTEEEYNRIYDVLDARKDTNQYESKDFDYASFYNYLGIDHDGDIMHHNSVSTFSEDRDIDDVTVYTREEILSRSVSNSKRVYSSSNSNPQLFTEKATVFYTDGSTYTLKNIVSVSTDVDAVEITYNVPDRIVKIEQGITLNIGSHVVSVSIDKQHLAGIVHHIAPDERVVMSFSKLFASRFSVANTKQRKQENLEPKARKADAKSGLPVGNQGKVGDRVKIRKDSGYYEYGNPSNPTDVIGEICATNNESGFKYQVKWDNDTRNSYTIEDLEYA